MTTTGVTGTAVTGNITGGLVCKDDAGSPAFNDQGRVVAINSRAGQAGRLDASSTDTEVTDTRIDNIVDWMRLNTFETTLSPVLSAESDGRHVGASLPGVNDFGFVVKTVGQADAYYGDQTSSFVIPLSYAGKAVIVGARAEGSGTPWAAGVTETVPAAVPKLAVESDGWHVDAVETARWLRAELGPKGELRRLMTAAPRLRHPGRCALTPTGGSPSPRRDRGGSRADSVWAWTTTGHDLVM